MLLRVAVVIAVLGLAACGSNRHCQTELPYQRAQTLPPPAPTEGLKWPESPSALRIPPAPEKSVPYAYTETDAAGSTQVECLDVPPRMPPDPPAADAKEAAPTQP